MALKRHIGKAGQKQRDRGESLSANGRDSATSRHENLRKRAEPLRARRIVDFRWADAISEEEWDIYRSALAALRSTGVPFLLGGGFALATFTGRWRDTKDIDFYVHPRDRKRAVSALTQAGFADYYATRSYDRKWIYRSTRSGVIVDIIWSMANQRAQVDDQWFAHAQPVVIRGQELKVVPLEEFLWCKLYIIQRDHCDWTDIFNVMCTSGQQV